MYEKINFNKFLFIIPLSFIVILFLVKLSPIYSTIIEEESGIQLYDPKLKIELITDNLESPTNLGFLTNNDLLVYEKSGNVKLITDGKMVKNQLLTFSELANDQIIMKGLIAKEKNKIKNKITHDVFFYYIKCDLNKECTHNISSFELDNKNQELLNHKLLLSIKSDSQLYQMNGIIRLGTDDNIYLKIVTFEDQIKNQSPSEGTNNWLDCIVQTDKNTNFVQNNYNNKRIIQPDNGHGLRYSFGTDYDPYSGKLWYLEREKFQTEENSRFITSMDNNLRNIDVYDVINSDQFFCIEKIYHQNNQMKENKENSYKSLIFLDSKALGKRHMNNLFVTTSSNEILEFDLPGNRNGISLITARDNISGITNDTSLFANGFEDLNDLQINPYDGTLYVLDSASEEGIKGSIYKIDRKDDSDSWFSP